VGEVAERSTTRTNRGELLLSYRLAATSHFSQETVCPNKNGHIANAGGPKNPCNPLTTLGKPVTRAIVSFFCAKEVRFLHAHRRDLPQEIHGSYNCMLGIAPFRVPQMVIISLDLHLS
jgi:hypothetical protein